MREKTPISINYFTVCQDHFLVKNCQFDYSVFLLIVFWICITSTINRFSQEAKVLWNLDAGLKHTKSSVFLRVRGLFKISRLVVKGLVFGGNCIGWSVQFFNHGSKSLETREIFVNCNLLQTFSSNFCFFVSDTSSAFRVPFCFFFFLLSTWPFAITFVLFKFVTCCTPDICSVKIRTFKKIKNFHTFLGLNIMNDRPAWSSAVTCGNGCLSVIL